MKLMTPPGSDGWGVNRPQPRNSRQRSRRSLGRIHRRKDLRLLDLSPILETVLILIFPSKRAYGLLLDRRYVDALHGRLLMGSGFEWQPEENLGAPRG